MIKGRLSFKIFPTIYEIYSSWNWTGSVLRVSGENEEKDGFGFLRVSGENQEEGRVQFSGCLEITKRKDGLGSPGFWREPGGKTGSILRLSGQTQE